MKDGKREREDVDVDFRQKGEASKRLLIRRHGGGAKMKNDEKENMARVET
jgi:hypothetical protein